jgi:hypothetical protein
MRTSFLRNITIIFGIFLFTANLSGQKLFLEWAVPLKKDLVQLNKRETGSIVPFGKNDVLVTTRSGDLHLFSQTGKIKKTLHFDGEFSIAPVIMEDGNALISVSNSVFMLDKSLNVIWNRQGKAPVAAAPLATDEFVFVQFHDNSIYVLCRNDGSIKTAYTSYSEEEISYLRLPSPIISDDKYVFGFSSGLIVYFMLRKTSTAHELVPYFRFRTAKSSRSFEKKVFYDLLSFVPFKDTLLFSGGEYGGYISEGKPQPLENMKNLNLFKEQDGKYTGYGEGGISVFDEDGSFISKPFSSTNYVTNLIKSENYAFVSTTGEGSIISYSEGYIHLLSQDYTKILHSAMIPNGVSSKAAYINEAVFIISDMGVVYKFKVVK